MMETIDDPAFDIEMELLIQALLMKYHYDFRHYSRSSVRRRLQQALTQLSLTTVSELQSKVLRDPTFFSLLLNYLTVPTTEMFRDPSYFAALRYKALPFLKTFPSLKVWIAGCSTGEEVYSMAILFKECGLLDKTMFYATDINPQSLESAKRGIYRLPEVQKASANYLKAGGEGSLSDYYSVAYDAAHFDRALVKNVVFSDHSLATDAVFTEAHLVSCRNVLIYFDRELQDRAMGLFFETLARSGILGLGSKESLHFSRYKNHFDTLSNQDRLFQKKEGAR